MANVSTAKDARWYVVHAYSGHEEKVRANLLKRVDSMDMHDKIFDVLVPTEEVMEIIDGPFTDFHGKVTEINVEKGKLKVLVNMFGRETPVELDLLQVERLR